MLQSSRHHTSKLSFSLQGHRGLSGLMRHTGHLHLYVSDGLTVVISPRLPSLAILVRLQPRKTCQEPGARNACFYELFSTIKLKQVSASGFWWSNESDGMNFSVHSSMQTSKDDNELHDGILIIPARQTIFEKKAYFVHQTPLFALKHAVTPANRQMTLL